jgi:hypothetical protein
MFEGVRPGRGKGMNDVKETTSDDFILTSFTIDIDGRD